MFDGSVVQLGRPGETRKDQVSAILLPSISKSSSNQCRPQSSPVKNSLPRAFELYSGRNLEICPHHLPRVLRCRSSLSVDSPSTCTMFCIRIFRTLKEQFHISIPIPDLRIKGKERYRYPMEGTIEEVEGLDVELDDRREMLVCGEAQTRFHVVGKAHSSVPRSIPSIQDSAELDACIKTRDPS